MRLGDVVDQFLNQHGLAHAGAAEQADLAALQVGAQQIDDLDAGHEDLGAGRLFLKRRGSAVDRHAGLGVDRALFVDRLTDHVHDAAQCFRPNRHHDRRAGIDHFLAADHAVGAVHRDAADGAFAQFLRHFQHQGAVFDLAGQRVLNERQLAVELHVHDRPEDLGHATDDVTCHKVSSFECRERSDGFLRMRAHTASAPEMISISSLVMLA